MTDVFEVAEQKMLEKIKELKADFVADLTAEYAFFNSFLNILRKGEVSAHGMHNAFIKAHNLKGNAQVFGFPELSQHLKSFQSDFEHMTKNAHATELHLNRIINGLEYTLTLLEEIVLPTTETQKTT